MTTASTAYSKMDEVEKLLCDIHMSIHYYYFINTINSCVVRPVWLGHYYEYIPLIKRHLP
jgi:hypothetical protein